MTPEIQKQIDEIWAILRETARRQDRAEKRMDRAEKRMDRAEKRMDRAEREAKADQQRWKERMDRFENEFRERVQASGERAEKIDRQLQATARLVAEGIKLVRQNSRDIRELQKAQRAFLASFRNGHNGRA
jgi:hypothetical protein